MSIRRCSELGHQMPDLTLTYRAMESIYSVIFDKAEPQLSRCWLTLNNALGLPHIITADAMAAHHPFVGIDIHVPVPGLHGADGRGGNE